MQPQKVSCHSTLVLCTLGALTKQGWQICGEKMGKYQATDELKCKGRGGENATAAALV